MNGNICYKYVNATVVPGTTTYSCPDGYVLSGTSCISTVSRIEQKAGSYSCPSGYNISGDQQRCTNVINSNKKTTSGETTCKCPSGYSDNGGNGVRSYTGTYHAGQVNYSDCPAGWSTNGTRCTKPANSSKSWSNPKCDTYTKQQSVYENSNSKRVLSSHKCDARGCSYTYCTYTAVYNYSCSQGSRDGSTCYINRTQSTTQSYYTCNDGRTQSTPTCNEYTSKNCTTTSSRTEYSCPDNYQLSGDNKTCSRTVKSTYTTKSSYSCPVGYNISGDKCVKVVNATPHTTETEYSCPDGYVRQGTTCYQYTEPTTKKTYRYDCPTGYTKEGEGENTKCSIYTESTVVLYCETDEEKLVGNKCVKTVKGPLKGYQCPDGYILNNDQCIKHSLECVEPNAITNSSTSYEYKWSSESSVDGWTQTGKTRGIVQEENLYDK